MNTRLEHRYRVAEELAIEDLLMDLIFQAALMRSGKDELEMQEMYGLIEQVIDGPEYPRLLALASQHAPRRAVLAAARLIESCA